jgi:hypothetical protein
MEQQQLLFERYQQLLPPDTTLEQLVAELLEITPRSATRRIKGEIALTYDDYVKLHVFFDKDTPLLHGAIPTIPPHKGTHLLMDHVFDFYRSSEDLNTLTLTFQKIHDMINSGPSEIMLASNEIPIYHYFQHPFLFAFRLQSYRYFSGMRHEDSEPIVYNPELIPGKMMREASRLYVSLCESHVQLMEFWHANALQNTLSNIKHFWNIGVIDSDLHLKLILDDLQWLLRKVKKRLVGESASVWEPEVIYYKREDQPLPPPPVLSDMPPTHYKLYFFDVTFQHNIALFNKDNTSSIYCKSNMGQLYRSLNPELCHDTEQWFKGLGKIAHPIGLDTIRDLTTYFRNAELKVKKFYQELCE